MIKKRIRLYGISKVVAVLTPLYISICAALLIDVKSHINCEWHSILYFLGLSCFIIGCYISNELYRRSCNYDNIYDTEISEYWRELKKVKGHVEIEKAKKESPSRENIYDEKEEKIDKNRNFEYYGVFGFGIIGLALIIWSYSISNSHSIKITNQEVYLQHQVDSLKMVNCKQEIEILQLKQINDSIVISNLQLNNNLKKIEGKSLK